MIILVASEAMFLFLIFHEKKKKKLKSEEKYYIECGFISLNQRALKVKFHDDNKFKYHIIINTQEI